MVRTFWSFLLFVMLNPVTWADGVRVDLAWLDRHRDARVLFVDVRSPEHFRAGHVPGAVNLPAQATWSREDRADLLPPVHALQELVRAAGIRGDEVLVLYDEYPGLDLGRVYWLLELAGVRDVRFLEEGFAGWRQAGRAIESGEVRPEPSEFVVHLNAERLATRLDALLAAKGSGAVLLDARPPEEYLGEKRLDAPRAGHIPGAVNVPVRDAFTGLPDASPLKDTTALRGLYSGIPESRRVIAYCRRGRGAGLTYMLLRDLGYRVSVYDGSWYEWSRDLLLPVEAP